MTDAPRRLSSLGPVALHARDELLGVLAEIRRRHGGVSLDRRILARLEDLIHVGVGRRREFASLGAQHDDIHRPTLSGISGPSPLAVRVQHT